MITFMRRYRRSLQVGLLLVIGAFIASLFVFGQRGFGDGAGRDAVATVNGESIPVSRYQRAYQAYVNMYSQMSRAPVTPELAERFGIDRQAIDALAQWVEGGVSPPPSHTIPRPQGATPTDLANVCSLH